MLSAAVALLAAGPLCDEARAKAAAFPRGVCPHIPASTEPAFVLGFTPACEDAAHVPLRECVTPTPPHAVEPNDDRLWAPPATNLVWPNFPAYQHRKGDESWTNRAGRAGQQDCVKCFLFLADRVQHQGYVSFLKKPLGDETKGIPFGTPQVRTVLDLGCGSGTFLATLLSEFPGTQGIGLTLSHDAAPFLEAMGARGILGLRHDFTRSLPFADHAFDVVHSRMSGLRFVGGTSNSMEERLAALRRAVLEYDRVLRPGGYFVQVGWKLATKFSVFASDAGANAARTLIERARPRGKEEERRWIDDPVYAEEAWVEQVLSKWHGAGADAPTSGEPAAAVYNRTARFFRGVAAELEWEELYFSQTDDGEQIDCAYKKRLRRRRHPPGHSRLE